MRMHASVQQLQAASAQLDLASHSALRGRAEAEADKADATSGAAAPPGGLDVAGVASNDASRQALEPAAALAARTASGASSSGKDHLGAALRMYSGEQYVLLPSNAIGLVPDELGELVDAAAAQTDASKSAFIVGIKEGARGRDKLQATLQAAWHAAHRADFARGAHGEADCLLQALHKARAQLPDFVRQAEQAGWDPSQVIMWSSQRNLLSL